MKKNIVTLDCKVVSNPEVQITYGMETIYECEVSCMRNSGKEDIFKVQFSKSSNLIEFKEGDFITIVGELRTTKVYVKEDTRKYLRVYIHVKEAEFIEEPAKYRNSFILSGYSLSRDAILRKSYDDETVDITDLIVEVPRGTNKVSYIPCTAWNNFARLSADLKRGDVIEVEGRLQSHKSTKGHILVEVSVSSLSKL